MLNNYTELCRITQTTPVHSMLLHMVNAHTHNYDTKQKILGNLDIMTSLEMKRL